MTRENREGRGNQVRIKFPVWKKKKGGPRSDRRRDGKQKNRSGQSNHNLSKGAKGGAKPKNLTRVLAKGGGELKRSQKKGGTSKKGLLGNL